MKKKYSSAIEFFTDEKIHYFDRNLYTPFTLTKICLRTKNEYANENGMPLKI